MNSFPQQYYDPCIPLHVSGLDGRIRYVCVICNTKLTGGWYIDDNEVLCNDCWDHMDYDYLQINKMKW
jgi:hypothetical protein